MHWAESYVGQPYIEGERDCAHFVVTVLGERFSPEIALPAHAAGVRTRDAQIEALAGAFALPTIAPRVGDGVLMREAGRRRVAGHHIGVWCAPSGVPHVLHCLKEMGVCLHPIRALARHGLEMTGIYRWL